MVGGPEDSDTMGVPSKWHNGRQYDHVVDVDFEDGVPHKKLAFNRTDNPYDVAERSDLLFELDSSMYCHDINWPSQAWQREGEKRYAEGGCKGELPYVVLHSGFY